MAESLAPAPVPSLADVVQVAAAARFPCARQKSDQVSCWGANALGQLGTGVANSAPNPSPTLTRVSDAIALWVGDEHGGAVRRSVQVACWGAAARGQIGSRNSGPDASSPDPATALGLSNALEISTGGDQSCATTRTGAVYCRGATTLGQLGDGIENSSSSPVRIVSFPRGCAILRGDEEGRTVQRALKATASAVASKGSLFAIGDVHGCDEELRALLQKLPLNRDSLVVFLGDYIDRGPNSRGVVDTVLELQQYCRVVCLLGNHELMLSEFLDGSDARRMARFIYNGGGATLASYADDDGCVAIPPEHLEFYKGLSHYHVEGDYCFVHAGLPVDVDELDVELHGEDLVWMRMRPGAPEPEYSKIVVHGHTPRPEVEILPRRINLDTSCVYGHALTAMEVHSQQTWRVERSTTPQPIYLRDSRDSRRKALRFTGRVPVTVQYEGRALPFETTNYSELGILMHHAEDNPPILLPRGATIQGVIGVGVAATPFRGVILRVDAGRQYAVKLIFDPPSP